MKWLNVIIRIANVKTANAATIANVGINVENPDINARGITGSFAGRLYFKDK